MPFKYYAELVCDSMSACIVYNGECKGKRFFLFMQMSRNQYCVYNCFQLPKIVAVRLFHEPI